MRTRAIIGTGAATAVLAMAVSAWAATAVGVRTTQANEALPAAGIDSVSGDSFLAWSQSRPGHRNLYDAYLKKNAEPAVKLNRRGRGWSGGLDTAAHMAVYQQARNGNSDVILYDWATGTRSKPGLPVNTPKWEYDPSVSGHWLAFARLNASASPDVRRLLLYDRDAHTIIGLDTLRANASRGTLVGGQVNGDWVVWSKVSGGWDTWSVFRHQISTGQTERVPRPSGRFDYAPSVTADGTMYFFRSGSVCGNSVGLRSYDTAGVTRLLFTLPAGRDAYKSYASDRGDGTVDVFYDSVRCAARPPNWNIYKVNVTPGSGLREALTARGGVDTTMSRMPVGAAAAGGGRP